MPEKIKSASDARIAGEQLAQQEASTAELERLQAKQDAKAESSPPESKAQQSPPENKSR
jgi:hypothetical protein